MTLVSLADRNLYNDATPIGAKSAPLFQLADWSKPSFSKVRHHHAAQRTLRAPVTEPQVRGLRCLPGVGPHCTVRCCVRWR